MGAKHLNPVSIMCELTQAQIEHLVNYVSDNLPIRLDELNDIDELMFGENIRLCVDFEVDGLSNIVVADAEVLDRDWDVLHSDSFALMHYLQPVVDRFNRYRKKVISQSHEIQADRRRYRWE